MGGQIVPKPKVGLLFDLLAPRGQAFRVSEALLTTSKAYSLKMGGQIVPKPKVGLLFDLLAPRWQAFGVSEALLSTSKACNLKMGGQIVPKLKVRSLFDLLAPRWQGFGVSEALLTTSKPCSPNPDFRVIWGILAKINPICLGGRIDPLARIFSFLNGLTPLDGTSKFRHS